MSIIEIGLPRATKSGKLTFDWYTRNGFISHFKSEDASEKELNWQFDHYLKQSRTEGGVLVLNTIKKSDNN